MTNLAEVDVNLESVRASRSSHEYLGYCGDLLSSASLLEPGTRCQLPLLPLADIVLTPNTTLPLKLVKADEVAFIQRALAAPAPHTRLIAVTCVEAIAGVCSLGCIAEIQHLRWQPDGSCHGVARGLQRIEISSPSELLSYTFVTVLDDQEALRVPPEAVLGLSYWQPSTWQLFDSYALATSLCDLCSKLFPRADGYEGGPLGLSWWLAANLPSNPTVRQKMLTTDSVFDRLTVALSWLQAHHSINCLYCQVKVADISSLYSMSDEGPAGIYVNPYGCIHDMVTVCRIQNVVVIGILEAENSWFKDFAWSLLYCKCGHHLGWQFTSISAQLQPAMFFGIRRAGIA